MIPRSVHRWIAWLLGYFWLPCPLCGEEFGGHEWRPRNGHVSEIPDPDEGPGSDGRPFFYVGICPTCTRRGLGCRARAYQEGRLPHDCTMSHIGMAHRPEFR